MIKQLTTKLIYQNPWLKLREDQVEFANGHQGIYSVVEKDHFALIVPFDGTHLHLVQQFRYPTQQLSLEFPQGKHEDGKNTDPAALAKDELEEELGLRAGKVEKIGFFYEAPGYSSQGFHIFLATDLQPGTQRPDITEADLLHVKLSPEEFEQKVLSGELTDAPTVSAYGLLKIHSIL